MRAPTGTRIEATEFLVDEIDRHIQRVIPANELESISDNIGLPLSYDLAYYPTDSIGPQDADMLIELKPNHQPTATYQEAIRAMLKRDFPRVDAYFQAADIISQVLNFGLLRADRRAGFTATNLQADYDLASRLRSAMQRIPGIADLRIAEPLD